VHDVDLTGTVPPGRFTELSRQVLRASGQNECRTTVTAHSLVCAIVPPRSRERAFEYRGLSRTGFRYPVVGSSIAEDAHQRDFSINALLYDMVERRVLDGSGLGLGDLRSGPLIRPLRRSHDPLTVAELVIRALKFLRRWELADLNPELVTWLSSVPDGFWDHLTDAEWAGLATHYRKAVGTEADYRSALLPGPVRCLVENLIGRLG